MEGGGGGGVFRILHCEKLIISSSKYFPPNIGSLVERKNGLIDCKNIKNVAPKCSGVAPNKIAWHKYGPFMSAASVFYDFEHNTEHDWPAHDPCGKRKADHKKGVANPGGAIFLR